MWMADPHVIPMRRGYRQIRSNRDPLDLVERDLIPGAVVKLGGARALMRRHGLCVFERAAGLEIGDGSRIAVCANGRVLINPGGKSSWKRSRIRKDEIEARGFRPAKEDVKC
jgi:hypothetical protein